MNLKILNIISLSIGIIGTALIFYNSPFTDRRTFLYRAEEANEIERKDKRTRNLSKTGFALLCVSYIIQTVLAIIQFNK